MACRLSWATSMPRHHHNRLPRLETETLRPRRGRRLRLLHRHRRKRPLILCRSRWKRRHLLSHRKHSGCSRRVCLISKPCCSHSPEPRPRRRMQGSPAAVFRRSLLRSSNINNLNSYTPIDLRLRKEQGSITSDDLAPLQVAGTIPKMSGRRHRSASNSTPCSSVQSIPLL